MAHIELDIKMRVTLYNNDPVEAAVKKALTSYEASMAVGDLRVSLAHVNDGMEPYVDWSVHLEP